MSCAATGGRRPAQQVRRSASGRNSFGQGAEMSHRTTSFHGERARSTTRGLSPPADRKEGAVLGALPDERAALHIQRTFRASHKSTMLAEGNMASEDATPQPLASTSAGMSASTRHVFADTAKATGPTSMMDNALTSKQAKDAAFRSRFLIDPRSLLF